MYTPSQSPAVGSIDDLRRFVDRELTAIQREFMQGFQPYDVVWNGDTTPPVLGNGLLSGQFLTIGHLCLANVDLRIGSTTTLATGGWSFSLPVAAQPREQEVIGSGYVFDNGTAFLLCAPNIRAATPDRMYVVAHNAGNLVSQSIPMTWAANDRLHLTMVYPWG